MKKYTIQGDLETLRALQRDLEDEILTYTMVPQLPALFVPVTTLVQSKPDYIEFLKMKYSSLTWSLQNENGTPSLPNHKNQ